MTDLSILWRRLDLPGHESARLFFIHPFWHLAGTAVFAYDRQPCRLDYLVLCDSSWQTVSAAVTGWVGNSTVQIGLAVDSDKRWRLDTAEQTEVAGCIDIDLNFSPSTNLLPIRRSGLAVGQEVRVRAAWLRFPGFNIEPLEQLYRRVDEETYLYESAGGRFATEIRVNAEGMVTKYADIWEEEATAWLAEKDDMM